MDHDRAGLHTVSGVDLRGIIQKSEAILFDFDGPVCSVFAGSPPHEVAAGLIRILRDHQQPDETLRDFHTNDPLEVLRYSERFGPAVVGLIEDALIAAELHAIRAATPTPGGAQSIRNCVDSGRLAAIVTNNSAEAVDDYIASHGLLQLVHVIVGRHHGRPDLMKPSGEPLKRALEALAVDASVAVFVGDSPSDIVAGRAAGTVCVGLANKPAKWRRLSGADSVIGDMAVLADQLDASPARRA